MTTKCEVLIKLYDALNHPSKAGPKWVTYNRTNIELIVKAIKELAIKEGAKVDKNQ